MKLAAALSACLLVVALFQGSLLAGDEPIGRDLLPDSHDPTGKDETPNHDDLHNKLASATVGEETCHGHDKACAFAMDGPWLPGVQATMASEEICTLLLQSLDPDLYQIIASLLCDNEEPGDPLPDPPVPLPGVSLQTETDHYLGFDGADLHLQAGFEISYQGLNIKTESTANASVRQGGGEVPPPEPGQVPCSDPRGCPDLVVDASRLLVGDIVDQSFAPGDCAVDEGSTKSGERRLLRFTFTTPNLGRGDLVIGNPEDNPQWFEWGECHEHWHFESFADYRLWTPDGYAKWQVARAQNPDAAPGELLEGDPSLEEGLVSGHKQGFCLVDIRVYVPFSDANYRNCHTDQGITVGWADEYHYLLDGQWVDITDVTPGLYFLEAEVNPDRLFQESDYTNNAGAVLVAIPPAEPVAVDPPVELPEEELDCDTCLPDLSVDTVRLLPSLRYTTQTFSETDCNVAEGSTQPGTRNLIRFTTKIPNLGNATLAIGNPQDHPDLFEWGDCHGHWHYMDFVDHRLWNLSAYQEWREARNAQPERPAQEILDEHTHLREGLVTGHKLGFCLIDVEPAFMVPTTPSRHRSCSNQGISAGWADVYGSSLDGQFIDVTDVPPGMYVLELEVNPGRTIQESSYEHNAAAVLVPIT